jgi:hypothetical protein
MKPSSFALASFAALMLAAPALAHHSHAMYDATGEINISGTIKEMRWANPHVWMYIDVKAQDGTTKTWALEGAAINQLERKGWKQELLPVGATVDISCYPLRSGGPGCLGGYILKINNEVMPATHGGHAGREFD